MLAPPAHAARPDGNLGLPENESLLFAFGATSGRVTRTSDRRLQLVLDGVKHSGIWFSDRPQRDSGTVSTRRLVDNWSQLGFVADPPNAVLSLERGRRNADTVAIELGRPRLSRSGHQIRVGAKLLHGPLHGFEHLNAKLDSTVQRTFDDATLFIDNAYSDLGSCTVGEINYIAGPYFTKHPLNGSPRAQGQLLSIEEYPDLFALLGTRFGGDGQRSFGVPDLAGPAPNTFPLICASGIVPRASGPYPPACLVGQIQLTAAGVVQPGWLPTDGRTMQAEDFPGLFQLEGANFGGDGQTTFALPTLAAPPGLAYLICAGGVSWSQAEISSQFDCTMATLDLFATPMPPPGHISARGSLLQIRLNQALYGLIGATFGGDGKITLAAPNIPGPLPWSTWSICGAGSYPKFE